MRAASLVLPIVLFGCGARVAQPSGTDAPRAVDTVSVAVPGEAMELQIKFRGVIVGRVQVAVGQPGWVAGHRAIIVRSHGASEGVLSLFTELTWELTTTVDLDTGFPLDELEESRLVFRGKEEHERSHHAARSQHNVHSAAGAIRGWRTGELAFPVEIAGGHFELKMHEAGHEFLPSAKTPAVRIVGTAHEKFPFTLWLSDDAHRVPLRLEADTKWGSIVVDLVDYEGEH